MKSWDDRRRRFEITHAMAGLVADQTMHITVGNLANPQAPIPPADLLSGQYKAVFMPPMAGEWHR